MSTKKKLIKVADRGMILTSRGMVRGPIERPYLESTDAILLMLTRFNNEVYEVLSDNSEVRLNINNFSADNNVKIEKAETIPVRTEVPEQVINPEQAINKNMSRKERKRLEYERQMAAKQSNTESHSPDVDKSEDNQSTENADAEVIAEVTTPSDTVEE